MGETGCGKTRLIRFMCNLASQGSGQRNMLILKVHVWYTLSVLQCVHPKALTPLVYTSIIVHTCLQVHGGTTEDDILAFLEKAEETAKENRTKNLDTVVFFDEANTTDAIGLIKEIMCDRRANGKPTSLDLKFIAACNPYRR